jgi:hypothetical protein
LLLRRVELLIGRNSEENKFNNYLTIENHGNISNCFDIGKHNLLFNVVVTLRKG